MLLPAYNDTQGLSAALNRNVLARINREAEGTFDLAGFRHEASFNARLGRVELHLISAISHWAGVSDRAVHFLSGESILTEIAYKYEVDDFLTLARSAGWHSLHAWTDRESRYAVHVLAANNSQH
jgi:uncharacterized SAM-dependent methyltransferase